MLRPVLLFLATIATGFGTVYDDDWPPQRFQRLGTLSVTFTDQAGIDDLCGKAPTTPAQPLSTKGCSLKGKPHIVMDDPCLYKYETYARRTCHELAHALGRWPVDHPK
jgi:hypothetical protein